MLLKVMRDRGASRAVRPRCRPSASRRRDVDRRAHCIRIRQAYTDYYLDRAHIRYRLRYKSASELAIARKFHRMTRGARPSASKRTVSGVVAGGHTGGETSRERDGSEPVPARRAASALKLLLGFLGSCFYSPLARFSFNSCGQEPRKSSNSFNAPAARRPR